MGTKQRQIEARKLHLLFTRQAYSQTPVGIVASLINGIILVAALWAVVPAPTLLLWYGGLAVVMGLRFINWLLYRRAEVSANQTRPWIYRFHGVMLLSGMIWGSAAILLFPRGEIAHQVFLVFILGGMVAGAAAILAHFPLAFFLYAPPVVLPLAVTFLSTGARIEQAMGALLLIFSIVMVVFCLRVHRILRDTHLSRLRNRRLVKRMARARDLAENLNQRLRAEITEREKTERELQQHRQDLEALVQARTREVREVNQDLQRQIELYHRSEAALRESEERFRTIFETATDAIFLKNREGRYLLVNPAMETLFQTPESEFLGHTDDELFEPALRSQLTRGDFRVLEAGQVFQEEVVADSDSRSLVLNVVKVPVRNPEGEVIGFCGIARDVSESRQLESRIREAQKLEAIATLAGGLAHDFNNILTAIMGYTELLQRDLPDDPKTQSRLSHVMEAVKKAAHLVQQILAFSRQQRGRRRPVHIHSVLQDVIRDLSHGWNSAIDVRLEIAIKESPVLAELSDIDRIIRNLCENAVLAMEDQGGILTLEVDRVQLTQENLPPFPRIRPGPHIQLVVTDTGTGMTEDVLEHVFEPYFTTRSFGSGLGLAVTHALVRSLHGAILAESEPGNGSRFIVLLPETAAGPEPVSTVEQQSEIGPSRGARILFVDDEESLAQLGKQMLESIGYQVTVETQSSRALRRFQRNPEVFDLVITDMIMPEMNGDVLSSELLSIRPDLPIILYTGFSDQISEQRALELGIRAFRTKPLLMRDLALTVDDVLQRQ